MEDVTSCPDSRVLQYLAHLQRQTVEQIPITVVNYGRNLRRKSSFFIYGTEREVFFPGPTCTNSFDSTSHTSESSTDTSESGNLKNLKPLNLDLI